MDALMALTSMVFLLLAAAWNHDDLKNTSIKVFLWVMFALWAFQMLRASGYIVRVTP